MRLLLLPLLLLCALVARAGDGGDLAITAPGTIWKTDDKVLFAWNTGKSTFTVRILVNSHETLETKSVKDKSFSWQPDKLKAGDKVQVWVYDSAGASGKTAQIAVQQGDSGSSGGEGGGGEKSKTAAPSSTTSKAAPTSNKASGSGVASETGARAGGGGVASDDAGSTAGSKASSAASSGASAMASVPGRAGEDDEAAESSATSAALAALSGGSSATSATASSAAAATGAVDVSAGDDNLDSSTVDSSSASSSQDSTSSSTWRNRKTLYLGLGGLVLAFLLGIAIYLWWRQSQPAPEAGRRRSRRDERSLGKRRRRPHLAVVPPIEHAALLSDDLERGSSRSPGSASSASSGVWSDEGRSRGRRGRVGLD